MARALEINSSMGRLSIKKTIDPCKASAPRCFATSFKKSLRIMELPPLVGWIGRDSVFGKSLVPSTQPLGATLRPGLGAFASRTHPRVHLFARQLRRPEMAGCHAIDALSEAAA